VRSPSRIAPSNDCSRFFAEAADEVALATRAHFLFRFAVEALAHQQRPREHLNRGRSGAGIMDRDVDDEADDAIVLGAVGNVERFGDAQSGIDFEFGDLRVGQEGELARDLLREERRVIADAIGNLVRTEDDLVGVRIPQTADAALGR
jgi:hypothetical protein